MSSDDSDVLRASLVTQKTTEVREYLPPVLGYSGTTSDLPECDVTQAEKRYRAATKRERTRDPVTTSLRASYRRTDWVMAVGLSSADSARGSRTERLSEQHFCSRKTAQSPSKTLFAAQPKAFGYTGSKRSRRT